MLDQLRHRIADAMLRSETFRRQLAPDAYEKCLTAAAFIIEELGIQEVTVTSDPYSSRDKEDGIEEFLFNDLRRGIGREIAENTPLECVTEICQFKHPGLVRARRMSMRALAITRNNEIG